MIESTEYIMSRSWSKETQTICYRWVLYGAQRGLSLIDVKKNLTSSHSCSWNPPLLGTVESCHESHLGGGVLINLRRSHTQATWVHDADRVGMPRTGLVALCFCWPAFLLFFTGSSTPYGVSSIFLGHSDSSAQTPRVREYERTTHRLCPYRICSWSPVGAEGGACDRIRVEKEANDRTRHTIGGGAHAWEDNCMLAGCLFSLKGK